MRLRKTGGKGNYNGPMAYPRMNIETEKDPRISEVVPNSAMTFGIAGENMAEAVGLKLHNFSRHPR